jgi:hypothetical protein
MPQNMFSTTPEVNNYLFITMYLVAWQREQKYQNLFLSIQDIKKYHFLTMYLVAWQHVQMHHNLFFRAPDVRKYLFYDHLPGGSALSTNASEIDFNLSRH